jgi:hypothetical protein
VADDLERLRRAVSALLDALAEAWYMERALVTVGLAFVHLAALARLTMRAFT